MALATSYNVTADKGSRENLESLLKTVEPTETPLYSTLSQSAAPKATLNEWLVDSLEDPAGASGNIDGIVFGRVDFSESLGVGRDGIHSEVVTNKILEVAELCKDKKLDLVVGGAVSSDSLSVLKQINDVYLSRFETRKVVFSSKSINETGIKEGLVNAVHFELLWLKNKKEYYSNIEKEDDLRIEMLNKRWNVLE